jgi:hypothetical protein
MPVRIDLLTVPFHMATSLQSNLYGIVGTLEGQPAHLAPRL